MTMRNALLEDPETILKINAVRRAVQKRALAGHDPTDAQREVLGADQPRLQANATRLLTEPAMLALSPIIRQLEGTPVNAGEGDDPVSSAVNSHPDVIRLRKKIDDLRQQQIKAQEPIKGARADSADKMRADKKAALDGQIEDARKELDTLSERIAKNANEKYLEALPFAQRYPAEMQELSILGTGLSGPIAGTLTGRLGRMGANNVRAIEGELKTAIKDRDPLMAAHLNNALLEATKKQSSSLVPGAAAGLIGAEIAPTTASVADFNSGNKSRMEDASKAFTSFEEFAKRYGVPALTGFTVGLGAGKIANAATKYKPRSYDAQVAALNDINPLLPYPTAMDTMMNAARRKVSERFTPQRATGEGQPGSGAGPQGATASGSAVGSPQQLQPAPVSGAGAPPPSSPQQAYATYDPATHGAVSREHLDDMLNRYNTPLWHTDTAPQTIIDSVATGNLPAKFQSKGLPPVDPDRLLERARGSAEELAHMDNVLRGRSIRRTVAGDEVRQQVLNAATGRNHTLTIPGAVLAGAAAAASSQSEPEDKFTAEVSALSRILAAYRGA